MLKLDTEKAGLWSGGTFFVHGQHTHGDGVSDALGLVMPVSFYESESFTQVSELWLHQELPHGISLRVGKQDANRDFAGPRDTAFQLGGWHHSDLDRSGLFAIADLLLRVTPGRTGNRRSVQLFVRGQWEPDAAEPDTDLYLGGGATVHGFTGTNNTVGVGAGYVSLQGEDEGFLELFFKWRPLPWFSLEPDVQFYFQGEEAHVLTGLRCKVKL